MRNFLFLLREKRILGAVIGILSGLVLVLFPNWALHTAGILLGLFLAAYGLVILLDGVLANMKPLIFLGAVLLVLGAIIAFFSSDMLMWLLISAGIFLIFRGVLYAQRALRMRSGGYRHWWGYLVCACLILLLGFFVVLNPFGAKNIVIVMLGICLVFNAVEGMLMQHMLVRGMQNRKASHYIYVESEDPETKT